MIHRECPLVFHAGDDRLLGILTLPPTPAETAVLVIVGGPQYRAGSHRQFVHLCRRLAGASVAAMRFDLAGMGDSGGERHAFEDAAPEIGAAIDALQAAAPGVRRVVLWGLCDGASAALMYWHLRRDPRVAGLCLANPWVRSDQSLARTTVRHYYRQRLLEAGFWKKLLAGKFGFRRALADFVANLRRSRSTWIEGDGGSRSAMAEAFRTFPGPILVLIGGKDLTGREFEEACRSEQSWMSALRRADVQWHAIPDADHTFSSGAWREEAESVTLQWLERR